MARAALAAPLVGATASRAIVASSPLTMQTRGMAESLYDMRTRIAATANVAQLTGVMKLVAASKLRGCEEKLAAGKPFGLSLLNSIAAKEEEVDTEAEDAGAREAVKHLWVVLTTDRGLCGSVNSNLTRQLAPACREVEASGDSVELFILGEKGGSQLSRVVPENIIRVIDNCFDKDPTFGLAAAVAEQIANEDFDVITFWYNEFVNAAKFDVTTKRVPKLAGMPVGQRPGLFADYSVEPEDNEEALLNMMEYGLAGSLYYMMLENMTSETASRMTAMDSATNNANEMVDALTLTYNRARQAKITTELTEIVAGAESLEAQGGDE